MLHYTSQRHLNINKCIEQMHWSLTAQSRKNSSSLFSAWAKKGTIPATPCTMFQHREVNTLRVLGIIISDPPMVSDHITNQMILCKSSLLYALHVLQSRGIPSTALHDVFSTTSRKNCLLSASVFQPLFGTGLSVMTLFWGVANV